VCYNAFGVRVAVIDQFRHVRTDETNNKPTTTKHVFLQIGDYSPELRTEVYFVKLNFNISKLIY